MVGRLGGRVAIISGGGSGIGRATALRFASEGAHVAVLDLDRQNAEETAQMVADLSGEAIAITGDVRSSSDADRAVETALKNLGRLDILFNNAGIDVAGSISEVDERDWDRCFDVNVKGTFLLSRAAVSAMTVGEGAGGVIINQASVAATVGIPKLAAYCAAKGAVVALTRSMAVDLAPLSIRVNAICPGTVYTPLIEPLLTARGEGDFERGLALTVAKYPIGRLGSAEEIAGVAVFLASDESSFVTGSVLVADGGMTAQ